MAFMYDFVHPLAFMYVFVQLYGLEVAQQIAPSLSYLSAHKRGKVAGLGVAEPSQPKPSVAL